MEYNVIVFTLLRQHQEIVASFGSLEWSPSISTSAGFMRAISTPSRRTIRGSNYHLAM